MNNEVIVLAGTAAGIGFIHTILGPDHYVPFIVMSKARGWSGRKTAMVTSLCGLAHVLSSVLLGAVGLFLGIVVFKLESIESFRGDLAGWLLIAFGLVYLVWGIRYATRDGAQDRTHEHSHGPGPRVDQNLTPWVLFTIFVLGPCEPLIPLIMYPAAKQSIVAVAAVAVLFGITTIATMLASVMASYYGLSRLTLPKAERYLHALAGFTILLCGCAIMFLGL
jgi:sulfite exporter TauE/SafE